MGNNTILQLLSFLIGATIVLVPALYKNQASTDLITQMEVEIDGLNSDIKEKDLEILSATKQILKLTEKNKEIIIENEDLKEESEESKKYTNELESATKATGELAVYLGGKFDELDAVFNESIELLAEYDDYARNTCFLNVNDYRYSRISDTAGEIITDYDTIKDEIISLAEAVR